MAEQFYTILTNTGKAKIANSLPTGQKVNLTKMKIGDSNGTYYNPSENQTELVHKVYECNVTSVEVDEINPSWITITAAIPSDVGGFSIREVGIFDDSNSLIAIGKYPETYKPVASDGSTKELYIKMTLEVTNAASVELKIDPTVILATKKDISNLDAKIEQNSSQLKDMMYQTAAGTTTALILTINGTLKTGYPITFIASANNGGTATTINGKKLYKPATTNTPTLIAGKAYTVWYNSTGDSGKGCFFIKASAEGNTIASHVLANDTFSNDNDTGLVGTMPNNGALGGALGINGSYTIPAGYTTGGTVTQSITTKSSATYTPGTTNQTIAANQFLSGIQTILGDANLLAANIISGKSIFGVAGGATIETLGGRKIATGTVTSSTSTLSFAATDGAVNEWYSNITGFSFVPSYCIIYTASASVMYGNGGVYLYDKNAGYTWKLSSNTVDKTFLNSSNVNIVSTSGRIQIPSDYGHTYNYLIIE